MARVLYTKDGPQVILTTREAAALLTLSPSMLRRYRVRGGEPRYLQIGGAVRYARVDLLEWVLTMRRDGIPEEQAGAPTEKGLNFDPVLTRHVSGRQLY